MKISYVLFQHLKKMKVDTLLLSGNTLCGISKLSGFKQLGSKPYSVVDNLNDPSSSNFFNVFFKLDDVSGMEEIDGMQFYSKQLIQACDFYFNSFPRNERHNNPFIFAIDSFNSEEMEYRVNNARLKSKVYNGNLNIEADLTQSEFSYEKNTTKLFHISESDFTILKSKYVRHQSSERGLYLHSDNGEVVLNKKHYNFPSSKTIRLYDTIIFTDSKNNKHPEHPMGFCFEVEVQDIRNALLKRIENEYRADLFDSIPTGGVVKVEASFGKAYQDFDILVNPSHIPPSNYSVEIDDKFIWFCNSKVEYKLFYKNLKTI